MATRDTSNMIINRLAAKLPNLMGGSADLGPANKSQMKEEGVLLAGKPQRDERSLWHQGICHGCNLQRYGAARRNRSLLRDLPCIQRLHERRYPYVGACEAARYICPVPRLHRSWRGRRNTRANRASGWLRRNAGRIYVGGRLTVMKRLLHTSPQ